MNQRIKLAKASIRSFIRQHWDDQRLAAVYAFCRAGRMGWRSCCECIVGVTTATPLHHASDSCHANHFFDALDLPGAIDAERGHEDLETIGFSSESDIQPSMCEGYRDQESRGRRRLSSIFRAEMRRRDRKRAAVRVRIEAQHDERLSSVRSEWGRTP